MNQELQDENHELTKQEKIYDRSSLLIMYTRKYSILGQNTVLRRKQVSYFSM